MTMHSPNPLRHAHLKEELRLRGASLSQVAADLDLSPSTVTIVSQGYRRSHRVQAEIARRLGTTAQALFPERYPGKEEDVAQ